MQEQNPKKEPKVVSDVGDRIRAIREKLQMIPSDFAQKAGLSNSIIYEVESGQRQVGLSVMARLSKTYGVSLNWLALGIGPMYLKDTEIPFRGDALEILGKNYPVADAPDLADLLRDKDLVAKLEITADEIRSLCEIVKSLGRMARLYNKDEWIETIRRMRQVKLDVIHEVMDKLKGTGEKE